MHEGEKKNEDDTLFFASNVEEIAPDEMQYTDSGCSNHITGNKKVFVDLDEYVTSEVRTSDDKRLSVKEKGDILVQTKKGEKRISSVFNVLGLNIIFFVSTSFYFEDFMLILKKICVRSRTRTIPLLQR